ncbi:hypothetical protein F5884DRAFT_665416 [Xylogone sp. PMI_703]|nr:hypothetical protein F5884DRAFT_665416 [Xylogone sp. PMI_703]
MPPPIVESITVINKSGKVISTGKHLVNIFKDAKDAYQEKRAELKAEQRERLRQKYAHKYQQKFRQAREAREAQSREDTQSVASSRHSRRSHSSHKSHRDHRDRYPEPLPPLSEANLSRVDEGDHAPSQYAPSLHESHQGSAYEADVVYRNPYAEIEDVPQQGLVRRHTDFVEAGGELVPADEYPSAPLHRSHSNPDTREEIDMGLAYGELPPDLYPAFDPVEEEKELNSMVFKIENLLLEAQCLHHSATAIMAGLQDKPDAMAAVALTLAELSNLLTKVSPSLISILKGSSPAIFALLASPQFLIGTGVALGVTIIMFGGFKIIKKIQGRRSVEEPLPMEEEVTYDEELSSIEYWRRGIADVEAISVATGPDGEFITPESEKLRLEKIRERAKEERRSTVDPSVIGSSTSRKEGHHKPRSRAARSESGRTERSVRSERSARSERTERSQKPKKETSDPISDRNKIKNALAILFKKDRIHIPEKPQVESVKDTESESGEHRRRRKKHHNHQPTIIEV